MGRLQWRCCRFSGHCRRAQPCLRPWVDMDYLLGQWIRGLVSDAEVQKQLGEHVLELFLAQRDLCEAGTWRQEDAEPGAPGEPLEVVMHEVAVSEQVLQAVADITETGSGVAPTALTHDDFQGAGQAAWPLGRH